MRKQQKALYVFLASALLWGCGNKKTVPSAGTIEPAPAAASEITASAETTASAEASSYVLQTEESELLPEDTQCDDKACVAQYLSEYDQLPSNYMTKDEAREYGWNGGALHLVVEGMCIGGDVYSNYEGTLPEEDEYHECDIDTLHSKKRGAKRIVYSDDGDIWYTDDHYETFELLYENGVRQ